MVRPDQTGNQRTSSSPGSCQVLLFPLLPLQNINLFLLLMLTMSFFPLFFPFTLYKSILSNSRQVQLWLICHRENNIKWSGATDNPVQSLPLID